MSDQTPSVGRIVHYVSYGTPGGEYMSECRAAIITEVVQDGNVTLIHVAVLNPTGMFFNGPLPLRPSDDHQGGTWHWPEKV